MEYKICIHVGDLHKVNDIFIFLKKIIVLRQPPDYVLLEEGGVELKTLQVVPLKWIYFASALDFFNWVWSFLEKNAWYDDRVVKYYITVYYNDIDPNLKLEVELLRSLISDL